MDNLTLYEFKENRTYRLIYENLMSCVKCEGIDIKEVYHHNTEYQNICQILKQGLLSYKERCKKGYTSSSKEEITRRWDDNLANGFSCISLSRQDKNIVYDIFDFVYSNEKPRCIDILVSKDILVRNCRINYVNEVLSDKSIPSNKFISIDLRIIKYMLMNQNRIEEVINFYNIIIDMANIIASENLNLLLREVSNENNELDISKLKGLQKIKGSR